MTEPFVNSIIRGNCLEVLPTLPAGSIDCVVTSPPYWLQREYHGLLPSFWPEVTFAPDVGLAPITIPAMTCCHGNEAELWAYVAHEVSIFREVRRVLADHGVCWLNLGDCYATSGGHKGIGRTSQLAGRSANVERDKIKSRRLPGLSTKDKCSVPHRVAHALQADGWILRSEVIWHKPSPMPESGGRAYLTYHKGKDRQVSICPKCQGVGCVGNRFCWLGKRLKWSGQDRCTTAHEQLFMLSKRPDHFFDAEAIKTTVSDSTVQKLPYGRQIGAKNLSVQRADNVRANASYATGSVYSKANRRDVWKVSSESVSEKHFAAFPTKLVEPCILAGCPAEVCRSCGKPRVRVVEKARQATRPGTASKVYEPANWNTGPGRHDIEKGRFSGNRDPQRHITETRTIGWSDCGCGQGFRPGIVLDPFAGTGRVGVVAVRHGRDYVLVEASDTYIETITADYIKAAETGVPVAEIRRGHGLLFEENDGHIERDLRGDSGGVRLLGQGVADVEREPPDENRQAQESTE